MIPGECLRLQLGPAGTVWCGTDQRIGDDTGLVPAAFLSSERFRQGATVRVIGSAVNAPLIAALCDWRAAAGWPLEAKPIHLCHPAGCGGCDPRAALQASWYARRSHDGFAERYELTAHDRPVYALVAGRGDPAEARRRLADHPVWPALSFLAGADLDAAAKLLGEIVDARWFRHPQRPNRTSRLDAFLGLTPERFATIAAGLDQPDRYYRRALLAATVWLGHDPRRATARAPTDAPGDFLRRLALAGRTRGHGLLAATRRLVRLIHEIWRAERSDHNRWCFEPRLFFDRPGDAQAYQRHRQTLPR